MEKKEEEKFVPYHQHLLMKCWVENPPVETEVLNKWFINLVETVGMNVVAGPTSVYVSDPGNEGLTGTVTLATSHASIHIWDAVVPSLVQFDIYSCKEYDIDEVLNHLNEFGLQSCDWIYIDRNNGVEVTSKGKI